MRQSQHLTAADWEAIRAKHAAMTPAQARAWIRKVMGPPKRTLEGKEREQVLLLLAMMEPYSSSNNQHSWTECYMMGEKDYHVTTFPGEDVIVDLMLPEDDQ